LADYTNNKQIKLIIIGENTTTCVDPGEGAYMFGSLKELVLKAPIVFRDKLFTAP
jgi:hypothetical protein